MPQPPLFLAAGIPRSGSTWIYNAMRLLLQRRWRVVYACWVTEYDPAAADGAEAVLVKLHGEDRGLAEAAEAIVTGHRDLRDVACSARSMGWAADEAALLDWAGRARRFHDIWAPRAALDLPYRTLIERPSEALARLAELLGVAIGCTTLDELAVALAALPNNRGEGRHDAEFLTHRGHRNDGRSGRWREQLPPAVAAAIAAAHGDWLARFGYLAVPPRRVLATETLAIARELACIAGQRHGTGPWAPGAAPADLQRWILRAERLRATASSNP